MFRFTPIVFTLLAIIFSLADGGSIGVNYGRIANNLPSAVKVVQLLKSQGINRVKVYDTDPSVLKALSGSGIKVTVDLPNELLFSIAKRQSAAYSWIQRNVAAYFPSTQIESIAVGNEVFVDPHNTTLFLVPAMKNIHQALVKYNLHAAIKISSPIALSALQNSYPSSSGSFRHELIEPVFKPMLDFLRQTGSYLMVNAYPFFAYESNADVISLDYALFRENPGVVDSGNGLRYLSLFDAQIDAVFAAMSALKYDDIEVVVTETGWPSKGDQNEVGASLENAAAYNGNLGYRDNRPPVHSGGGERLSTPVSGGGNLSASVPGQSWCVANGGAGKDKLQPALDYACGEGGADCHPIQPGSTCFNPNTLEAHASYAFNSYYQKKGRVIGTCYFGGAAYIVTQPPKYGKCEFPTGY
ncbi:hypothetical protein U1Q18_040957 [Sarracenia purpurea var. burkii]